MSYREVMSLPMRTFWLFNKNINRLFAEQDMRRISVLSSVNASEGLSEKIDELTQELGHVTTFEEVFDADAMSSLMATM